ncbi:expressed unknown protein [Seminavis robusta]|uniref:Uncharacterized protein n=1 Tax=Seminavis robusta TaxID=568900 RepID=A0A9N8DQJ2_9STRA|nr:expressed unknown protein [Seminavis robusta]|eukprot:Sro212_g088200.1 n/a (1880) ;mRNA; r:52308-57947
MVESVFLQRLEEKRQKHNTSTVSVSRSARSARRRTDTSPIATNSHAATASSSVTSPNTSTSGRPKSRRATGTSSMNASLRSVGSSKIGSSKRLHSSMGNMNLNMNMNLDVDLTNSLDMSVHSLDNYGGSGSLSNINQNDTGMTLKGIKESVQQQIHQDQEIQRRKQTIQDMPNPGSSTSTQATAKVARTGRTRPTRTSSSSTAAAAAATRRPSYRRAATDPSAAPSTPRKSRPKLSASVPKSPARFKQQQKRQRARLHSSLSRLGSSVVTTDSRDDGSVVSTASSRRRIPRPRPNQSQSSTPTTTTPNAAQRRSSFQVVAAASASLSSSSHSNNSQPNNEATAPKQRRNTARQKKSSAAAVTVGMPKTITKAKLKEQTHKPLRRANRRMTIGSPPTKTDVSTNANTNTNTSNPETADGSAMHASSATIELTTNTAPATNPVPSIKAKASLLFAQDNDYVAPRTRRRNKQNNAYSSDDDDEEETWYPGWKPKAPKPVDKKSKYKAMLATSKQRSSNNKAEQEENNKKTKKSNKKDKLTAQMNSSSLGLVHDSSSFLYNPMATARTRLDNQKRRSSESPFLSTPTKSRAFVDMISSNTNDGTTPEIDLLIPSESPKAANDNSSDEEDVYLERDKDGEGGAVEANHANTEMNGEGLAEVQKTTGEGEKIVEQANAEKLDDSEVKNTQSAMTETPGSDHAEASSTEQEVSSEQVTAEPKSNGELPANADVPAQTENDNIPPADDSTGKDDWAVVHEGEYHENTTSSKPVEEKTGAKTHIVQTLDSPAASERRASNWLLLDDMSDMEDDDKDTSGNDDLDISSNSHHNHVHLYGNQYKYGINGALENPSYARKRLSSSAPSVEELTLDLNASFATVDTIPTANKPGSNSDRHVQDSIDKAATDALDDSMDSLYTDDDNDGDNGNESGSGDLVVLDLDSQQSSERVQAEKQVVSLMDNSSEPVLLFSVKEEENDTTGEEKEDFEGTAGKQAPTLESVDATTASGLDIELSVALTECQSSAVVRKEGEGWEQPILHKTDDIVMGSGVLESNGPDGGDDVDEVTTPRTLNGDVEVKVLGTTVERGDEEKAEAPVAISVNNSESILSQSTLDTKAGLNEDDSSTKDDSEEGEMANTTAQLDGPDPTSISDRAGSVGQGVNSGIENVNSVQMSAVPMSVVETDLVNKSDPTDGDASQDNAVVATKSNQENSISTDDHGETGALAGSSSVDAALVGVPDHSVRDPCNYVPTSDETRWVALSDEDVRAAEKKGADKPRQAEVSTGNENCDPTPLETKNDPDSAVLNEALPRAHVQGAPMGLADAGNVEAAVDVGNEIAVDADAAVGEEGVQTQEGLSAGSLVAKAECKEIQPTTATDYRPDSFADEGAPVDNGDSVEGDRVNEPLDEAVSVDVSAHLNAETKQDTFGITAKTDTSAPLHRDTEQDTIADVIKTDTARGTGDQQGQVSPSSDGDTLSGELAAAVIVEGRDSTEEVAVPTNEKQETTIALSGAEKNSMVPISPARDTDTVTTTEVEGTTANACLESDEATRETSTGEQDEEKMLEEKAKKWAKARRAKFGSSMYPSMARDRKSKKDGASKSRKNKKPGQAAAIEPTSFLGEVAALMNAKNDKEQTTQRTKKSRNNGEGEAVSAEKQSKARRRRTTMAAAGQTGPETQRSPEKSRRRSTVRTKGASSQRPMNERSTRSSEERSRHGRSTTDGHGKSATRPADERTSTRSTHERSSHGRSGDRTSAKHERSSHSRSGARAYETTAARSADGNQSSPSRSKTPRRRPSAAGVADGDRTEERHRRKTSPSRSVRTRTAASTDRKSDSSDRSVRTRTSTSTERKPDSSDRSVRTRTAASTERKPDSSDRVDRSQGKADDTVASVVAAP